MVTDEAATDLCALLVIQAVPALALDPKVATLGWDRLVPGSEPSVDRYVVIGFVTSAPIRSWAAFMKELDDEDRADEWDDYRAETLILAEVIIGSTEVFQRESGWDRALECEAFVGNYRNHIWHRAEEPVLSDLVLEGGSFRDLVTASAAAGRRWADECRLRNEAAARPWPPPVPRIPPPRPQR